LGSVSSIALNAWYHSRLLERRRLQRYQAIHSDTNNGDDIEMNATTTTTDDNEQDNANVIDNN
jgi:hypothetical protein